MHFNIGTIVPLHDYILIKRVSPDEQTPSGLQLVHFDNKNKSNLAQVVAVGPGRMGVPGTTPTVKPGDLVLTDKWIGVKVDINGEEHILIKWYDICCVVTKQCEICEWCKNPVEDGKTHGEGGCY